MKNYFSRGSPAPGDLATVLQSLHSILGTVWPRPGYPELAGAKTFIGTTLFRALENAGAELDRLFNSVPWTEDKLQMVILWRGCHDLVKQLAKLGRRGDNPHVDEAFNLLYLSSGVLYHLIAQDQQRAPAQDQRFSTVRELDELVRVCQWDGDVSRIVPCLIASLAAAKHRLEE